MGSARQAAAHVVVADLADPALDPADAHHLGSVLRLRAGETVSATDGRGGMRLCCFAAGATLEPLGEAVWTPAPSPRITVALAPVKGDRTEWAVQKLTEVGVDAIVVMTTERTVVRWDERRAAGHLDRLRKVAHAAFMQSRRTWLPEITGPAAFSEVAVAPAALADPAGGPPDLGHPVVLVGPEGGWSPAEEGAGLPLVGLGPGVLRAETAAVAAGVLMVALRSGLVGRPAAT